MPFVSGFLQVRHGGRPDQGLPGEQPGIDNSLPGMPAYPDQGLPMPPPGTFPPPSPAHPIVPAPPSTPPGVIWPPIGRPPSWGGGWGSGNRPDQGLPGSQPGPDNTLPGQPATPDNTLPTQPPRPDNSLPSQMYWVVCGIPGVGWRYVCVDPSLQPGMPLPPMPTPEPK
jgi:hypothetical protein